MTSETAICKVIRTQRLTRIFCRIWLQPLQQLKLTAPAVPAVPAEHRLYLEQQFYIDQQIVELSAPSGNRTAGTVKRSYTMRQPSFDADGNLTRFALDIVVHDNMARYGITGMGEEVPAATLANPMMAGPMMAGPSIPMGTLGQDLAPGIIAAEDVSAGPGAAWAASVQVGDRVEVTMSAMSNPPTLYNPRNASRIWLLADPAGLPMLQNLVASYAQAESSVELTIFAQTPHKADRYDFGECEVFWALRGETILMQLEEKLPQLVADSSIGLPEYIWGALESGQAQKIRQLLSGTPATAQIRTEIHEFWTAK